MVYHDKALDESIHFVKPTPEFVGNSPPAIIKSWDGEYKLVKTFDQYHVYCNDDPEEGDGSLIEENFLIVFRVTITLLVTQIDLTTLAVTYARAK